MICEGVGLEHFRLLGLCGLKLECLKLAGLGTEAY